MDNEVSYGEHPEQIIRWWKDLDATRKIVADAEVILHQTKVNSGTVAEHGT